MQIMANEIRIKLNPTAKIIALRKLQKDGEAQVKFTKECAKAMNNYVPFLTGRLKDMMIELQSSKLIYHAPYAAKNYYLNKGNGKQGASVGGLRGKYWDKRMWNDKGYGIVKTIANFVGGRSK